MFRDGTMVSFRVPIIKRIKNTAFYAVDKSNGDLIKTNLRYFFMRENISYRFHRGGKEEDDIGSVLHRFYVRKVQI